MPEKRYLGDGVYVEFDGYQLKLTTHDGISDTNTVYLDDVVYWGLTRYVADLNEENKAEADAAEADAEAYAAESEANMEEEIE